MNIDQQIADTATRLRVQRNSWDELAFITTSLQVKGKEMGQMNANYFIENTEHFNVGYNSTFSSFSGSSGTVLIDDKSLQISMNVETSLGRGEDYELDEISIKPNYTNEFKIKVGALKVDRSLPKIFTD